MTTASVDQKYVVGGLGVLGVMGAALFGVVTLTTPGEQECSTALSESRVQLADAKARLELLVEAKDACKTALAICAQE